MALRETIATGLSSRRAGADDVRTQRRKRYSTTAHAPSASRKPSRIARVLQRVSSWRAAGIGDAQEIGPQVALHAYAPGRASSSGSGSIGEPPSYQPGAVQYSKCR